MRFPGLLLVAGVVVLPAAPADAEVRLTIQDGQVSLTATNATAREILAEWARVGRTTIVNGERVPGGPLTLELANVTEEHALQVILRSASGYVAAPRPTVEANASRFDRILVMPISTPTAAAAPAAAFRPPAAQAPQRFPVNPPFPFPQQLEDDTAEENDIPDSGETPGLEAPGQPIFTTFPRPQVAPAQAAPPPPFPGRGAAPMPEGVSVPGMIVPAPPPQPGMPVIQVPDPIPDPEDR
jgi:hypothetical protein